ncbi:stalk domain-containing protein [Butyricicoccus pullicaecorum]|uniref:stalk domain-containing protein n=1 Tax=Butyricicoccus pullicaecorum TaxID=501571 RepID=UPI003990653E
MKLRKRLSALIVSAALLLTALPAIAPATASAATTMGSIVLTIDSPTMTVNGTSKAIDAEGSKPTLDAGGYTMLPLRGVVEAMGGSLTWDAANRTVTMVKDGQTIKVPIGSTKLTVDGVQKDMLANNGTYKAAYINKSGRTLVHVRALQAFGNTTCTWNQTTKQVTVTYPMDAPVVSSKNYRVDLINQSGADINTLYYRSGPNGTYGKNVLTTTIKKNSTGSIYISVPDDAVSRVYDFYTEGSGTNVYSGINLTGVNAYVTVVLKENGKFEQANDKTITVSTGDTALKVENKSKLDIEKVYMSTDNKFSSSEIIWDKTIDAGDDETIDIDLDGTKTWYFQVVDEDGDKHSSGKVTFSSSTVKSATLTFSSSKKLSLKGSSSGDSTITFKNESGDTIKAIYMAGSKSELDDADDLLDSTLKDGKSVEIDMDLESDTSWYITVEFEEYSDIEEYSLSFDYKDPASATLEITKKAVEITKEKKSSSRGELSVAFVNTSGQKIVEAYLVDDVDKFDIEDYESEDDLLDGDGLADEAGIVIDEAADVGSYDLVLYYGSGDDDYSSISVDFDDATNNAAVWVQDYDDDKEKFAGEYYTDDDDVMLVGIYNDTGSSLSSMEFCDNDSDDDDPISDIDITRLSDEAYDFFELDTGDYDDINISWSGNSSGVDVDLSDEDTFAIINLEEDDDDYDFTLDSFDDISDFDF